MAALEPVTLETSSRIYLSDLTVDASQKAPAHPSAARLSIASRETAGRDAMLRVSVAGKPRAMQRISLKLAPGATAVQRVSLSLPNANRWSPDHPSLYSLVATVESGGPADRLTQRFGVRKVEARGREILLNGERFIARGVNRSTNTASTAQAAARVAAARRAAHEERRRELRPRPLSPIPDILSVYDELGIAMVEEVTLNLWGNNFSGQGEEVQSEGILNQAMPHLERMIARDKNHPYVIIWSMANESETATDVGISVMRKLLRRTKELDATRLTTFVISPQESSRHRAYEDADVVAMNVYHGSSAARSPCISGSSRTSSRRHRRSVSAGNWRRGRASPLLITEFGGRGVPGIHGDVPYLEDFQAALMQAAWRDPQLRGGVRGRLVVLGRLYHRRTLSSTPVFGPYGVVNVDRRPKAGLRALTEMYGDKTAEPAVAFKMSTVPPNLDAATRIALRLSSAFCPGAARARARQSGPKKRPVLTTNTTQYLVAGTREYRIAERLRWEFEEVRRSDSPLRCYDFLAGMARPIILMLLRRRVVHRILLIVGFTGFAFAQTGQITGLVSDPAGTSVPGANVAVTNVDTGIKRETSTNDQGYYTFALLNPGNYELTIQKTGFKAMTRPAIKLDVSQIARVDLTLTLGEVKDSVTVNAETPIITTESATIGQVIANKKILDLPLNGRDFTQLATLVPGAISRGTNSSLEAPAISVNGSRNSKTVFMVDGGSVTSQYFDVASVVPSVDAIQEFTVQSNAFAAENGQGTAIISASLRSGTNQRARKRFRIYPQPGSRRAQLFQHHRCPPPGQTKPIWIYSRWSGLHS